MIAKFWEARRGSFGETFDSPQLRLPVGLNDCWGFAWNGEDGLEGRPTGESSYVEDVGFGHVLYVAQDGGDGTG